jgi:hypothetical protein
MTGMMNSWGNERESHEKSLKENPFALNKNGFRMIPLQG